MDKYLQIKDTKIDNLIVSKDVDLDNKKCLVLLYTPNMDDTSTHYHIELSDPEILMIRDFLNDYLDKSK